MSKGLAVLSGMTMGRGVKAVRAFLLAVLVLAILVPSHAAVFVVPTDREMVRRADTIVVGEALASYTRLTPQGAIETVTSFSIGETIKGSIAEDQIEIVEPGGMYRDRVTLIPGVPRFTEGEKTILFLSHTPKGHWAVTDIALGKFTFETDRTGQKLAVRAENDIAGWDPDHTTHKEFRRAADKFLEYLRALSRGEERKQDYVVEWQPLETQPKVPAGVKHLVGNTIFTATSYTSDIDGAGENGLGSRWNVFPTAVNWNQGNTEPGAPSGGTTAMTTAFAAWNGATGASINYVRASANSNTNGITDPADMVNNVVFEKDLSSAGVSAYSCSMGGVLGIGGISSAAGGGGGHMLNGETFFTIHEGDVSMNQGIANCTALFMSGDFNTSVTHEVGHSLGFRHSDGNRTTSSAGTCSADPNLECSTNAVMKAFIVGGINATLQTWDIHAAATVYPGSGVTPPAAPVITATAASSTSVTVSWGAVTGATSYDVYRETTIGGGFVFLTNTMTTSSTDNSASANTAYLYRVVAKNSGGSSPNSNSDLATTVIFTDDPLVVQSTTIRAVHVTQLRTAVQAVRTLAGLGAFSFTDTTLDQTVRVKAAHLTELRSALDPARSNLGLSALTYTNPITQNVTQIKASHFTELRNGVK
jgi:hypothetical protein